MEIVFQVKYREEVIREDIPKLGSESKRIKSEIEKKLTRHPNIFGKPLRNSLFGLRSLRVGDYRVIYKIVVPNQVIIALIRHRSKAYKMVYKRIR